MIFFPYLKKHNIKHVIHLGDLVDRRKYISFKTARHLRQGFLNPLKEADIQTHIIIGNHDTSYRGHHEVNALNELVEGKYPNITIYTDPTEVHFSDKKMLFVPWICDSNYTKTMELLEKTNAQIVMGHLELAGFEMHRGSINVGGISRGIFDKFRIVCSGHYHHRSNNGNVVYLGATSEHTWADYNDHRGFHIFDTENFQLDFIQNPHVIFKKIEYDDSQTDPLKIKLKEYRDCIVKVVIKSMTNPYAYDKFINKLEDCGTIDVIPINEHVSINDELTESMINDQVDTISLFKSYVNQINVTGVDKDLLQANLIQLYNEAQEFI